MLRTENLCVSYGETRVINDVSISVGENEIVAILGRNGMGKTTLLNCLAGTLSAESGTILLHDQDITTLPAHERAKRGLTLIPQGKDIFPNLTVKENLKMGFFAAEDNEIISYQDVFDYFPILEDRLEQKGGTLSGGQQQMLAIARGLLTSPDLVLLDEPSEGIQPSIIHEIGNIIPQIQADHDISIVIVEQNIELVTATATRGYILENGRIVEEGQVEQLEQEGLLEEHIGI